MLATPDPRYRQLAAERRQAEVIRTPADDLRATIRLLALLVQDSNRARRQR